MCTNNENSQEVHFMKNAFCGQRCVFPNTDFEVRVKKANFVKLQRFRFVVEADDSSNIIQVRLTDPTDEGLMLISTVDTTVYTDLKCDQSLNVSFSTFVGNLTDMLCRCRDGMMQINLTENENGIFLQLLEVREFRNLVHLSLPIKEAPVSVALLHVKRELGKFKKKSENYEKVIAEMQNTISLKEKSVKKLDRALNNCKRCAKEKEQALVAQNCQTVSALEEKLNKLSEHKDELEKRLNSKITDMEVTVDDLQKENSALYEKSVRELRRNESVREDLCIYKCKALTLKKQNENLSEELVKIRSVNDANLMQLKSLNKELTELHRILENERKTKSNLLAELEAKNKANMAKRDAILSASEEITRVKEIIAKQQNDIIDLKQNIELRTDIVVKQEACMREKENQISLQKDALLCLHNKLKNVDECPAEYQETLSNLLEMVESLFATYSKRIAAISMEIDLLQRQFV